MYPIERFKVLQNFSLKALGNNIEVFVIQILTKSIILKSNIKNGIIPN